jgi:hypothetical protein
MKSTLQKFVVICLLGLTMVGCGSKGTSYSLLSSGQNFKQATVSSKIDLLWVVDNSPSMLPLQQNMTSNFNSFMSNFVAKGYDFHLAVTTTDTYRAQSQFANDPSIGQFRDGVAGGVLTGIYDILPSTLNLTSTFVTNATQGANGSGDENAFSSFKVALNSNLNTGFLRQQGYLGIIILSDEDDFSDPNRPEYSWTIQGGVPDHDYANPGLDSVDSYVSYLDTLTATTGATRRYGVSAIAVLDSTCQQSHVADSPSTIVGQRYIALANETNGELGSICDASYANSLAAIQEQIIEQSTQFYLSNQPMPNSIIVTVDDTVIPTDSINGWTYSSTANSIVFHGAAVPKAGDSIAVNFDPATLQF